MLKVKKQIKQQDGTVVEVEGTEAEVEAFERKHEKKQQSEQSKKERKLLLDSKRTLDKLTKKELLELLELLEQALAKQAQPTVVHHWYHSNGWWWRPWWQDGIWTYQYTQTDPNWVLTNTNGTGWMNSNAGVNLNANSSQSFFTCNSVEELAQHTGVGMIQVYSSLVSNIGDQPSAACGQNFTGLKLTADSIQTTDYSQAGDGINGIKLGPGSIAGPYEAVKNVILEDLKS